MESTWQRSVKRKIDEIEGGAGRGGPQIPAATASDDDVSARVEVENEVSALRETLVRQQQTIQDLTLELEEERNAASTAASETMSMILRLQWEKAEVQMEFRQFRRFAEERMAHDQQELVALDDLLFKREQAFQSLACEIKAYKHRLMSYGIDSSDPEPQTPQNFDLPDYDYPPLRCTIPAENFGDDFESSVLEKYTPTTLQHLQNLESRIYEMEPEKEAVVGPDSGLVRDLEKEFKEEEEEKFSGGEDQPSDDEENARVYTIDAVHVVPTVEVSNEEEEEGEKGVDDKRENVEDGDIKMLYMRLQALEADRESMRQAIISMRTEKAQLLLLKEIAQQLCKEAVPARRIVKKPSLISRFSFVSMIKVLFIDRYSGRMLLDSTIIISLSCTIHTVIMIYAQYLSQCMPEPAIDLKYPGILLFLIGIAGNFYHHLLLSELRNKDGKGYKIPRGGMFGVVICLHYLFEIVGFVGASLVAQTGYAFAVTFGLMFYLMGRRSATR